MKKMCFFSCWLSSMLIDSFDLIESIESIILFCFHLKFQYWKSWNFFALLVEHTEQHPIVPKKKFFSLVWPLWPFGLLVFFLNYQPSEHTRTFCSFWIFVFLTTLVNKKKNTNFCFLVQKFLILLLLLPPFKRTTIIIF